MSNKENNKPAMSAQEFYNRFIYPKFGEEISRARALILLSRFITRLNMQEPVEVAYSPNNMLPLRECSTYQELADRFFVWIEGEE